MQYYYLLVKTVLIKGYNVTCSTNERRDRTNVPNTAVRYYPATVRHAKEASLGVKGAQIFNLLPDALRNCHTNHTDTFKGNIDFFLSQVPDQPTAGQPRAS